MYLKKAITSKVNCNLSSRQLKKYKIFPAGRLSTGSFYAICK